MKLIGWGAALYVALVWLVLTLVAAVLAGVLWLLGRPFAQLPERRRGLARPARDPSSRRDLGDETNDVAAEGGLAGTYFDLAPNRAPIIEEVRLMPYRAYKTHIAGEPHEGTQCCVRCAFVLLERTGDELGVVGPGGRLPVATFWEPGAEVTVGPGWSSIGRDSRAVPCR